MIITDLPIETVEHIVADLDSPTDLQNLAAVYPQLRPIVEPNHTQFRVIRAPLRSPLWKELAEKRLLAKNVRIVEVQEECDDQVIPSMFPDLEVPPVPDLNSFEDVRTVSKYFAAKNATDLDAERILVSALKGMSGLTSFRWGRTPPLINHHREDDIWITLANHCPSLNVVDVVDCEKSYEPVLKASDDPAYRRPSYNPNFYSFKDLKSFSFFTEAFNGGNLRTPNVEQCAKMLVERCPNLEVLGLTFFLHKNPDTGTVFASPLLSGPPWNSLRTLALNGFEFITIELRIFLASHPTIEILSLMSCEIDQFLVLPPQTLPRLKQLTTDGSSTVVVNSILDSTIAIPRPLNFIAGTLPNDVFLDRLEQCGSGPNLNSLVMYDREDGIDLGRFMTRLSGIAPNLQSLEINSQDINSLDINDMEINADDRVEIDRTLYPVFGQFPYLRELKGMQIISSQCDDCDPVWENTERIQALATLCPNLRYIGDQFRISDTTSLNVIIERNGSHGTWSLQETETRGGKEVGVFTHWGARGQGSFEL